MDIPTTIDEKELRKLPLLKLAPSYKLQDGMGNGCAGDPPGYPTYFTRSVRFGNYPPRGPQLEILGHVLETVEDWRRGDLRRDQIEDKMEARKRRLWKPLPLDHPRTIAWIIGTYQHMHSCYRDENDTTGGKTAIWPVPDYKLEKFNDDGRFSDKWREEEKARVEAKNKEIIAYYQKLATPENHQAVITIRRFYPEYQPEMDLLEHPNKWPRPGNWWERLDVVPKPEECPGQYKMKHPVNGDWCQMCGWVSPAKQPLVVDKMSMKQYRCAKCETVSDQTTNNNGNIYITCKQCGAPSSHYCITQVVKDPEAEGHEAARAIRDAEDSLGPNVTTEE